jgi:hypothetical protein
MMDDCYYARFQLSGCEYRLWRWVAFTLRAALSMTGRSKRHAVEHAILCEKLARQRIAEGKATAWDLERFG